MTTAGNLATDRKQQLAEERTETAYRRTFLAEERTYSAWVRTGLAAIATGFAIAKLMSEAGPSGLIRILGAAFITTGGVMFGLGFWAYWRELQRVPAEGPAGVPIWVLGSLSGVLVLGSAIALALIFID